MCGADPGSKPPSSPKPMCVWNSPLVPASRIPERDMPLAGVTLTSSKPQGKVQAEQRPETGKGGLLDSQEQNIPGGVKTRPHLEWRELGVLWEEGAPRWTGGRPPRTSEVTARRPAFVLTEKGSHGRVLGVTWVAGGSLRLLCGPQTSWAEGAKAQLGGYCGRPWCKRRVPKMSVGLGKRSQCDSLENPMIHPKAPNIWPLITT